eukprot:scaffold25685_cov78-Phaeocystis_antarctica.AAC.6
MAAARARAAVSSFMGGSPYSAGIAYSDAKQRRLRQLNWHRSCMKSGFWSHSPAAAHCPQRPVSWSTRPSMDTLAASTSHVLSTNASPSKLSLQTPPAQSGG